MEILYFYAYYTKNSSFLVFFMKKLFNNATKNQRTWKWFLGTDENNFGYLRNIFIDKEMPAV